MKAKVLVRVTLLAALMSVSVSGCGGKKLQIVVDDPYTFVSNHRNLRINNGYSCEAYTDHDKFTDDGKLVHNYVIENVKALVVPVDFTDYPSSVYGSEENSRAILQKAIFSEEKTDGWYSLSSYYASSSFGQCKITGTVAPWWHTGKAVSQIDSSDSGFATDTAVKIQDYYQQHPEEINLADYDANKDGYVDSLIMIYSAPINPSGTGSGLWWAFCWSVYDAFGKYTPDGSMMGVHRYFWASMRFLFEYQANKYRTEAEIATGEYEPNSHTLVHEFGHVLSLPDYYITDYDSNDYDGLGYLDMMDYNIGDHNIYSKMMYGWVTPKRVTGTSGSVTVTIRSTTDTGDAIIIPAPGEWHDTYLDQYLTIEFLTPTGVAEKDSKDRYVGSMPLYFSKPGIRICQVDSRLGQFSRTNGDFLGYTEATKPSENTYSISIAADNTASRSCYKDYKLIEILPATGTSQRKRQRAADNSCLYQEGDVFGKGDVFKDFKLNGSKGEKDKKFGFKIKIDKIDTVNGTATITISR